ncbi:MAG TPA: 2-oxoglutarate dehydrogenase, E2 component, dihydrolipoamide succinyltransferase [Streptosporangiaceae bacterium]|jgi:2-oxoglutarate dehydrogenase E2 component (dihydrolipoamide succinyltransferase)|nr:2-oxoglutarate dehydrogenase, E2 component, dihydrolipoamide succinyltransferase [Streptosporangiaceae bacterium]
MAVSVSMPQLGESVSEGTVTRWLKKEGERVERDEPLLEISTDKVDTEIPSPAAGILRSITVAEDETVAVGAELATIDEGDGAAASGGPAQDTAPAQEAHGQAAAPSQAPAQASAPAQAPPPATLAPPPPPAQPPAPPAQAPQAPAPTAYAPPPPPPAPAPAPAQPQAQAPAPGTPADPVAPAGPDGPYVTPLVRKLASEHGVDLGEVSGTGVGGRIRKQDVIDAARVKRDATASAAAQPAAAPGGAATTPAPAARPDIVPSNLRGTTERISRLRQVIATRMVESLQTSAQLTTVVEADVTAIARLRDRAKRDFEAREGVKLSFLPFFALAAVEALKVHPKLNAVIDTQAGQITYHDAEHLGVAVDTERGLLVPVIHQAGDLNIGGLARKIADLAARTRSGHVSPDELAGGTFTLTNTGSRGALFDTPIINQPQVAILGTGTVVKRPVVVEDPTLGEVIAVRSIVYLALTYDHRLVDGADAARFLTTVQSRLEEGAFEAELGL